MHRYYAHALGAVLGHQPHFSVYALRSPFPPYATQYLSLIGLFHLFSFSMAEKVLTVMQIACFACGLRLCATAAGPAGAWVSLLIAPLLLPWYLLMGFFNYSIGLSLALVAIGCWLRMERSRPATAGFAVCALLLVVTHPVPVLLLLGFEVLDLLRRRFLMPKEAAWWKHHAKLVAGFIYTVCLAVYVADSEHARRHGLSSFLRAHGAAAYGLVALQHAIPQSPGERVPSGLLCAAAAHAYLGGAGFSRLSSIAAAFTRGSVLPVCRRLCAAAAVSSRSPERRRFLRDAHGHSCVGVCDAGRGRLGKHKP